MGSLVIIIIIALKFVLVLSGVVLINGMIGDKGRYNAH